MQLAADPNSLFFRALGITQRARMLDAVVIAVARQGFAGTTVADIVRLAGVSRRTFYEQFEDKLGCFLAAYLTGAEALLLELERATDGVPEPERLRAGLEAYTAALAAEPTFARVLIVDILGAGPRALALRERVRERFARLYAEITPDPDVQRAIVGGIAELVQARLLADAAEDLPALVPTFESFVKAMAEERGEAWVG